MYVQALITLGVKRYEGIIPSVNPMSESKDKTGPLHRMPQDLRAFLAAHPSVATLWDTLTPLARNEWICYVTIPKKFETRADHLRRLGEDLQGGKRRPCCWPGCPHRRPSAAKWFAPRPKKG